MIFTFLMLV